MDDRKLTQLYPIDVFIEGLRTAANSEYINKAEAIEIIEHLEEFFKLKDRQERKQ